MDLESRLNREKLQHFQSNWVMNNFLLRIESGWKRLLQSHFNHNAASDLSRDRGTTNIFQHGNSSLLMVVSVCVLGPH